MITRQRAKVLVVDDEPAIREMLDGFLTEEGFTVLSVASGQQALQRAWAERPDVILLDVMMPGLDGREVCRRLRADSATRGRPIALMSAASWINPDECGADCFLAKPFDLPGLFDVLGNLLRRYGGR